uniref:E3 ubiquitin-protein ligase listerin n=1 Tax=Salmo trutta TaxID=8032 RepID=A0A673YTB1_SALTR
MGGKNKQRTKGNVRPSSSGRAAELLARESGVVPGFVGFGTTATTELGYVPAVHGAEEIDNLVDADFRLVLRKLSKRDTVTKLKAVQEFGAMCQERDSEVVKGVLPYWPRIYCKISMDHDRRVREATQQAFEQLVLKVRRSLAPYLKSVMGHWLLSQCDSYPPAASAACQAFSAAFPPSKQAEALSFCKDEVFTVLQDNLLKETPDTLSDPQSVPEEEREAKFLRLLTSSLLGVKRLLSSLPQTDTHNLQDRLTHLLDQAKFWKYSRHKTPQVRGAFFEVVSSLCEHTPGLVQTEAARVCPAVLLSIDDTDPVVLPPLWEAVLHTLSTLTDCWSHVNARKAVLPKLWSLLKDGGKGLATALHPNLLPLISKLPTEVTTPNLDFYTTFYSCLIQGLSSERAVSSPSESAAIVVSAVECLRYTVLQNTEDEEDHTRIRSLLPLIDSALGSPSLQAGPLFPLVTDMLISWEKRAGLQDVGVLSEGENEVVFDRLLADFWEGLRVMFARRVQSDSLELKDLEGMSSLLQVMQSPVSAGRKQTKKKRSVKICFSEPESSGSPEEEDEVTLKYAQLEAPELGQETTEGPLKSWHLEEIVCQQAQISYSHVNEKNSERHLVYLSLLLRSFHTPRVFTVSLPSFSLLCSLLEINCYFLHSNIISHRYILYIDCRKSPFNFITANSLTLNYVAANSSLSMPYSLSHLQMDLKWGVLLQIIQKACADPVSLQACGDWFKGSVLGERLLGLAEELCEAGLKGSGSAPNRDSWALISLALSQHHNNVILYINMYCNSSVLYCSNIVYQHVLYCIAGLSERGNLEPLVCFICDVASTFFTSVTHCLLLASAEELLLTVFTLTAQDQTHTHLSGKTHAHTHTHTHLSGKTHAHTHTHTGPDTHTPVSDLSKTTAAQLSLSVEMMRFLSRLVTHSPTILGGSQWDFLLCSMLAWLETTSDNVGCLWNPWVQLLVCETCELIVQLNQFFTAPPPGVDDLLPSELTAEWNDFFIEGIYSLMLPLPVTLIHFFEPDDPLFPLAVLRSVGMALTYIPLQQLTHNSLPARFVADQKTRLPEALQTLLNTLTPLLLFKARPLQLTVYHILDKVMPTLPECDGEGDDTKPEDDGEEPCLSPPAALMTLLSTCEELCESIMAGVCVGEFAVVQPLSVEYSCILAYLLAWKLLLSFFKASPSHLRVQYSLYLKKSLHKLLLHLFRLMPENPAYIGQGAEPVSKETKTFFTESLSLDSSGIQYELSHLACCVYYSAVQDLPAMVRLWWTSQEKRVSHTVDKFTGRFVSPVLSAQEISSVHASTQTFDSMTVKARSAAREVIATYSVDDIFIELVIQLPQNYPLGSITVESGRRVGVAVQQWRNWMLQLSTYLTHQNGSIMEGLALWKTNVDKRFEGVEDCMICFSVIHGSNYSLPKKACRTCKKKFHSACLYKWFTSSNKSTCPLCRETFF